MAARIAARVRRSILSFLSGSRRAARIWRSRAWASAGAPSSKRGAQRAAPRTLPRRGRGAARGRRSGPTGTPPRARPWVTRSVVQRSSIQRRSSQRCIWVRVSASSAPNGSSRSTILRSWTRGAQERRALAHPAGELRRPVPLEPVEAEARKERPHPFAGGAAREALHLEPQGHVVDDPAPRHQRVALGHEGEGAPGGIDRLAVEGDLAAVSAKAADQQLEERRLAGARGAEDRDELAFGHVDRHAVEDAGAGADQRHIAQAQERAYKCRHGIETRWRSAATPKRTSVRTELISTAARTRSGRKLFLAFRMKMPRPRTAPAYSAKMAATTA